MNRSIVFLLVLFIATPAAALVLPPEGLRLTQLHIQFEWPGLLGAEDHELWIVEDDGTLDPFTVTPLVDVIVEDGDTRFVATTGFEFGKAYAWRVRGVAGAPFGWGATHRFEIEARPADMPEFIVTDLSGIAPVGLTLFSVRPGGGGAASNNYLVALDGAGELVWFHGEPGLATDVRLLDNGRILFIRGSQAVEATLNGQVAWMSPADPEDHYVHHEAFPMPNGDVLTLLRVHEDIEKDGEVRSWRGDRIVIFRRDDNEVIWEWNTFDHYSVLDFDQARFDNNDPIFDWTHGNAAVYNPDDDGIYYSSRQLSRVTRIDFDTREIVYNMGFDMPSGDTDFGDNLFSTQHAPVLLPNGNMLLFDNGAMRDHIPQSARTGTTKVVELEFTGDPPTDASIAWEWALPTYSSIMGNAERLPDGGTLAVSTVRRTIYEIDEFGDELRRISIEDPRPIFVYRVRRIAALVVDAPGDSDLDGVVDYVDNCPDHWNPAQRDSDGDQFGDVCAIELGLMSVADSLSIPLLPKTGWLALAVALWIAAGRVLGLRAIVVGGECAKS